MRLTWIISMFISCSFSHASVTGKLPNGSEIPGCSTGSQMIYTPSPDHPQWIACQNSSGLFDGLLFQLTQQGELIRVASVRGSQRHGKEIRFGASGFLEERSYVSGHLNGESLIFKSDSVLQRILPKEWKSKDWLPLLDPAGPSVLSGLLKVQPDSSLLFENGRISRIRFGKSDFQFKVTGDGRMMALNHPEMKNLFFIDPASFWNLGSDDLRKAILPGFGSCKKYSGPIGRFGRHYDSMMYAKETNEKKFINNLSEIRERFLSFCVPQDIRDHLGVMECPPQLPGMPASSKCLLPISDRSRVPYHPKFFKYEFGMKLDPESFLNALDPVFVSKFMTDPSRETTSKYFPPQDLVVLKKKGNRIIYRIFSDRKKSSTPVPADLEDRNWWEWHNLPGFD